MSDTIRLLNARTVHALDIGVVVWILVWAALGVVIWHDIGAQAGLSDSVVRVGDAVRQTGDALAALGAIPFVGGGIQDLAARVQQAGTDVLDTGRESAEAIHRTAVLAGLGAAVLPSVLVLLVYLPLRLSWHRDVSSLAAALATGHDDPAFEQYLAGRAIAALPWQALRVISDDPWRDQREGKGRALADAELARLGLRRPA
jgi:hypothetical protein